MALSYGQLLRLPGAPRMAASALVLGIAGTMAPVSFVLFAHRATGSFASASLVLAASTAGGLLAAPMRGRLVVSWAFEELDVLRVELTTTPDNAGVFALAERLGFAHEGVLRKRNVERGERVDVVWFGVLREEWR